MSESPSRKARHDKHALDELRREKHIPVAQALRDPNQAIEVIAAALEQLRLWRDGRLCSIDYIEAWEQLLRNPLQAATLLESREPWAEQLRQNSPFVAVIRRRRSSNG